MTEERWGRTKKLAELEEHIGYAFSNVRWLRLALRHSSLGPGANENYERLEFLGDSWLNAFVSGILLELYPHEREGKLTLRRARVVNRAYLSKLGEELGLSKLIAYSRSLDWRDPILRARLAGDSLEAIIGAVVLDGGTRCALRVVKRLFLETLAVDTAMEEPEVEATSRFLSSQERKDAMSKWGLGKVPGKAISAGADTPSSSPKASGKQNHDSRRNPRDVLAAEMRACGRDLPFYRTRKVAVGSRRRYRAEVRVGAFVLAEGAGKTPFAARQEAARSALKHLARRANR